MEFESIFITKAEYRWLRKLGRSPTALPSSPHEKGLMEYGLISRQLYYNEDGSSAGLHSTISNKGRNYLTYNQQRRRRDQKESARFFLSTILALLALIIAVIALAIDLWQLGLLRLQPS